MAALVAAAAAGIGDRTAWLAAILADRWRRPGLVIAMAAIAFAIASGVAAAGGALLAPTLTPRAALLLLAVALLLQGGGALVRVRVPDRLAGWRIGAAATALLGTLILAFGDGVALVVAALAARSALPVLAAVGATLGSVAVVAPAALLGEAGWLRLPLRPIRLATGALFVIVGAVVALQALGLA